MPKGGLSYKSREACIMDAKRKGVSDAPCANIPSNTGPQGKAGGQMQNIKMSPSYGGKKGPKRNGNILPPGFEP